MEKLNLVQFNKRKKTVTNRKFSLENAFQEVLYRIDNWINEGSGWIFELIESHYLAFQLIDRYLEVLM